jgi:Protein of unknown function (DUF3110)
MLKAMEFHSPSPQEQDVRELKEFCIGAAVGLQLVPTGAGLTPPEANKVSRVYILCTSNHNHTRAYVRCHAVYYEAIGTVRYSIVGTAVYTAPVMHHDMYILRKREFILYVPFHTAYTAYPKRRTV